MIFGVLEQVPVGGRLEEDALLLCRLATTKLRTHQRSAVSMAESLAHHAAPATEELEPDALSLRRRRPRMRASAEAVAVRARGLLLLSPRKGGLPEPVQAGAGEAGPSGGSACLAASMVASSRVSFARAAAFPGVYTRIGKTL